MHFLESCEKPWENKQKQIEIPWKTKAKQPGSQKGSNLNSCIFWKFMENCGNLWFSAFRKPWNTNKNWTENLEIEKTLEIKFMHFLESRDSGGDGKWNRGAVRKSYQVWKRIENSKSHSEENWRPQWNYKNDHFQKTYFFEVRLVLKKSTFQKVPKQ